MDSKLVLVDMRRFHLGLHYVGSEGGKGIERILGNLYTDHLAAMFSYVGFKYHLSWNPAVEPLHEQIPLHSAFHAWEPREHDKPD
jgi:hypothetical protein